VKTAFRIQHNGFGTALAAALDAVGLAVIEDVPLPTQLDKAAVGVAIGGLGRGVTVPSDVCIGNEDSAVPVAGQRLVGDVFACAPGGWNSGLQYIKNRVLFHAGNCYGAELSAPV